MREVWRIALPPHGKAVRVVKRGRRAGIDITKATRLWEDEASKQIEAQASAAFRTLAGGGAEEAPAGIGVRLRVIAVFRGTRRTWERQAVKPDSSNILKSVEDAATKAEAWFDDKLVVDTRLEKWRAPKGVEPCVLAEAWIVPVEPQPGPPVAFLDLMAAWNEAGL